MAIHWRHGGHHGFGHFGFRRWHRPRRHLRYEPSGVDADGDGDDLPPPPPPFPFPPLIPGLPPLPGLGEMEAERYGHPHHRHRGYGDDQEVSLNDEPKPRGAETKGFRRSGRWVRTKGKLILIGV